MSFNYNIPDFFKNMLEKQYGNINNIVEGYQVKRPVTLRVNTLKANIEEVKQIFNKENILFDTISWSKEAFILKNVTEENIRKLDIYESGKIYFQSLSSMLPPIILEPKPKESILDMAAAPGGKTTQMAALSQNQAQITACELNAIRAERLKYNIEKQGAKSTFVMVRDARKLDDFFSFDKILLDAPCSGSGTINSSTDFEKTFTPKLIQKSVASQTALMAKAIKLLKPGHEMVYSTCSILECENEEIVSKVLGKAEIVPIELKGVPTLPTKIKGTICVPPNEMYEGFFIAKIRKVG